MKTRILCLLLVLFGGFGMAQAQDLEIPLYKGVAPGSEGWSWNQKQEYNKLFKTEIVYNVSHPSVLVFKPAADKNTGTAVLIAPGGGFMSLSINREGIDLAKRLAKDGITAFVLKYRLLKCDKDPAQSMIDKLKDHEAFEKAIAPIVKMAAADAHQALVLIHQKAAEFGIKENKIGVIGFSAGGTVAMSTYLANKDTKTIPDFAASLYTGSHGGVMDNPVPSKKLPLFIASASDDQLKLTPASISLYTKWWKAGYPVEIHIYQKGGHGFGMGVQNSPVDSWINRYEDWLKFNNFL